ncbi:MAG: hypothetical protein COW30_03945 [Rhodospirillales bacterium CG15_BIG_FIL_POST_REV_8_21_14_020_66_15]|nr:MAG: hypothetical protein COW30_03945 [Rhodospirillales bacterium CG15_BIG_FIL_POST_REV_8_21_14_020_66_15]
MAFLSISIDLSGSTLAKQTLVGLSVDNAARRRELYNSFTHTLYQMERRFYLNLLGRPGFDMSGLYLVKSIGDEYWYVYEVDETDTDALGRIAQDLFEALIELFTEHRNLSFVIDGDGHDDDGDGRAPDGPVIRKFDLPIKAYVDLILEPIEVNVERYEYIKDIVAMLRRDPSTVYSLDSEFAAICNRLNLGGGEVDNQGHMQVRRDFIGLEIDRFFRMTRFCKPLLLGVGGTLMDRLDLAAEPVNAHMAHIAVRRLTPRAGRTGSGHMVIQEIIPAAEMKGISEAYVMHHLFDPERQDEAFYAPHPTVETLMAPTRAFLAESGFYALGRTNS